MQNICKFWGSWIFTFEGKDVINPTKNSWSGFNPKVFSSFQIATPRSFPQGGEPSEVCRVTKAGRRSATLLRYGRSGTRATYFRARTTASPRARTHGLPPAGVLLPSCNQTPKAPDARCPTRQAGGIAMRCIGAGPAVFGGGGDAAPEAVPRARAGACPRVVQ